jgi:hypothetical protein
LCVTNGRHFGLNREVLIGGIIRLSFEVRANCKMAGISEYAALLTLLAVKPRAGAGFTKPCTVIYICYRTTNTGTLPSARTSDV